MALYPRPLGQGVNMNEITNVREIASQLSPQEQKSAARKVWAGELTREGTAMTTTYYKAMNHEGVWNHTWSTFDRPREFCERDLRDAYNNGHECFIGHPTNEKDSWGFRKIKWEPFNGQF